MKAGQAGLVADQHQQVAGTEHQIGTGIEVEMAAGKIEADMAIGSGGFVRPDHAKQQQVVRVDVDFADALLLQPVAGAHGEGFEMHAGGARNHVVKRIEGHRLANELGGQPRHDLIRPHHMGGAGLHQFAHRFRLVGAGNDQDIRRNLASGEGDVNVADIIVGQAKDAACLSAEAQIGEEGAVGGIAGHCQIALLAGLFDALRAFVDDHESLIGGGHALRHNLADASETADYGDAGQPFHRREHPIVMQLAHFLVEGHDHDRGREGNHADAGEYQHHGHDPAFRRDRHDIAVTDRGERDDRPVERVHQGQHLAGRRFRLEQIDRHRRDQQHRADKYGQGVELESLLHQHLSESRQVAGVAEQFEQPEQQKQTQETQRPITGQDGEQVDDGHRRCSVGQLATQNRPQRSPRTERQAHQLRLLPMLDHDFVAVVEQPHAQQVFGNKDRHHDDLEHIRPEPERMAHLVDQQRHAAQQQHDHETVIQLPTVRAGIGQQFVEEPLEAGVTRRGLLSISQMDQQIGKGHEAMVGEETGELYG